MAANDNTRLVKETRRVLSFYRALFGKKWVRNIYSKWNERAQLQESVRRAPNHAPSLSHVTNQHSAAGDNGRSTSARFLSATLPVHLGGCANQSHLLTMCPREVHDCVVLE